MNVISDVLFEQAANILLNRDCRVAYSSIPCFPDKGDMYFFKSRDEADAFSQNNVSEYDDYVIIYARSPGELLP